MADDTSGEASLLVGVLCVEAGKFSKMGRVVEDSREKATVLEARLAGGLESQLDVLSLTHPPFLHPAQFSLPSRILPAFIHSCGQAPVKIAISLQVPSWDEPPEVDPFPVRGDSQDG